MLMRMLARIFPALALLAGLALLAARAPAQELHPAPAGEAGSVSPEHRTGPTSQTAATPAPGHEGAGGTHPGGDGGHEKKKLLPDPGNSQTWYSALWVIVIFLILVAILYPTAWKNVLVGLKKREQRIRTDIAEAEAARARAEQTLGEYNARLATAEQQVRDLIQKATVDAQKVADGIRTRAQQDAQEAKEKAQADIERARVDAVAQIYEQAATLATAVAERVLPRTLSADDQQALVNRSLDEIRNMGGPRAA